MLRLPMKISFVEGRHCCAPSQQGSARMKVNGAGSWSGTGIYIGVLQPTVSAKCEIPTNTAVESGSIYPDVNVWHFH